LLPELLNPLFLRTLCRSVKARGLTAIPRVAANLAWVFDGLIAAVNTQLSRPRRLDFDRDDNLVGRAVEALAEVMLEMNDETLPVATARTICENLYPERSRSKSLFEGMINEGLLLRERVNRGDETNPSSLDQVRFTYQRLGDHLRAEALLVRNPADNDLISAVFALAEGERVWSRAGLVEALVMLVPERRGVELASLLGLEPLQRRSQERRLRPITWSGREWLRSILERSFFTTLPWRNPRSITDATRALADSYLRMEVIGEDQWLTLMLSLACIPDHPFNVRFIDRVLRRMTMPERDEHWSDAVLFIWSEDSNPVARTIDWAWSIPDSPPTDVIELATIMLAWLFTSPNRRLRDTATKALLRLVEHNTQVLLNLIVAFAEVDDPYITERLMAVACGHVVRHRHLNPTEKFLNELTDLGLRVFDIVFHTIVPEHLMIRYYA
jgi:hypothetical protein